METKTTHTPGPWRAQRDIRAAHMRNKPGWNPDNPEHCDWAIYGPSYRVGLLEQIRPWCGEQENEANARLIAAAPDLLAACEIIAKVFSPEHKGMGADAIAVVKQARAAIAKARGE